MEKIEISSVKQLKELTSYLLNKGYKKFLLEGDLGAGKTEFTKQLAKNLGIKQVSSPTYTYINVYDNKFLHGDFYRINSQEEFLNLGLVDEIENYEYVVIEWPKFQDLYDDGEFLKIKIEKIDDKKRYFFISS